MCGQKDWNGKHDRCGFICSGNAQIFVTLQNILQQKHYSKNSKFFMANHEEQFKKLIAHAKEYGFIFPSSEIYDGLAAVYDYAPCGVELKKNIREYWWK